MLRFTKTRGRTAGARPGPSEQHAPGELGPPDVATNLRRLRQQHGYSLETLARLSGVSRAMLGQIETGKSAPTITLLWKVAKALNVSVPDLIALPPANPAQVLRGSKIRTSALSDGRFKVRLYSPLGNTANYEASAVEIAPKHREDFAALPGGTHATLIVAQGALSVQVGDAAAEVIEAGDAILFNADRAHSLFNEGETAAVAYLIIAPLRNVASK